MTQPNFMVIGLQIGKLHIRGAESPPLRPCQILKSPACSGLKRQTPEVLVTKFQKRSISSREHSALTNFIICLQGVKLCNIVGATHVLCKLSLFKFLFENEVLGKNMENLNDFSVTKDVFSRLENKFYWTETFLWQNVIFIEVQLTELNQLFCHSYNFITATKIL